jgi:hypothetical protein
MPLVGPVSRAFTLTYRVIPGSKATFALTGPSTGPAKSLAALPAVLRLNRGGYFDAANGSTYAYSNRLNYQAGQGYTVSMKVNPALRTYSVSVTPDGGEPVQVATNFAFRRNTPVGPFTHLALSAPTGTLKVNNAVTLW